MQDQQVRQSCNAIAAQIFHIAHSRHETRTDTPTADTNNVSASASRDVPVARHNAKPLPSNISNSSGSSSDGRAEALRRLREAVVRDAMTLYRLCHRPGGGDGIVIVPAAARSSGGGGGGGAVEEEAAYCVCAAIMARAPLLWASLVRRAELLRPRKPTLCFVAPVAVPPVVVRSVVMFYGRSRHLVPGSGGVPGVASPAVSGSLNTAAAAAAAGTARKDATVLSDGLSAQQAEAVAATFFFKTMSAAERQRRPDVFEVRALTSAASAMRKPSSSTQKGVPSRTAADASAGLSSGLPGRAGGDGAIVAADSSVSSLSSTLSSARGRGTVAGSLPGTLPVPPSRRPPQHPVSPSASASSFLFMDDWAGWRSGGGGASRFKQRKADATTSAEQGGSGDAVGGSGDGWSSPRSSSSDSSDGSSSRPSSDSVHTGEVDSREERRRDATGVRHERASARPGQRRHTRVKTAAATDAAVLERLYRLATSADAAATADAASAASEAPAEQGSVNNNRTRALGHLSGSGGATAGTSVLSASLFTSGKGVGLVALAAMTTQVRDALHWGRLEALVRFPILFRGLSTPPPLLFDSLAPSAATRALSATSAALTAASMSRWNNLLGYSYTSALTASPPLPSIASADSPASPSALHAAMDDFVSAFASPQSFLCPARLRASSLLPRPPSLITDTFLWTRLLICSAWLKVYADSLVDDESSSSSLSADDDDDENGSASSQLDAQKEKKERYAQPRVRPSPLVQEVVAYCVAIVREARAISAGITGEGDPAAFSASSSSHHAHGAAHTSAPSSNHHHHHHQAINAVCCPVCDCLVKEQQPVLWWSTLREDRAQLREQLRTLLESGSPTDAEARVAAAVAEDGVREDRGGRQYAAPQLSGSGAAGERVAALQERWGMFVMGVTRPSDSSAAAHESNRVASDEPRDVATNAASDKDSSMDPGDPAHTTAESNGQSGVDEQDSIDDAATRTLWAALTQRVAAATDVCVFLSTHPLPEGPSTSVTRRPASFAKHTAARPRTSHAAATAAAGVGAKRRRRRSTSSDSAAAEEETEGSSSSNNSSDEGSEADRRPRRRTHDATDAAVQLRRHHHHRRSHPHRPTSKRRRHSEDDENADSESAYFGDAEATTAAARTPSSDAGAFHGSRRAHEVAEEWERLLRRCGWVNAAPPPPSPRPPTRPTSTADALASPPSSDLSSSSAAGLYAQWAASLIQPSAMPTPHQAAVLRRRLSRYRLDDVVRALVLGRGGRWSPYAALMFGADALPRRQGPTGTPEQQQQQQLQKTPAKHVHDEAHPTTALDDVEVLHSAPPPRAASMSLLEEEGDDTDAQVNAGGARKADGLEGHDSLLLVTGCDDDSEAAGGEDEERVERRSAHNSPSPPPLTSLAAFTQRCSPLPPPPPLLSPLRTCTQSALPSSPVFSATKHKLALPSIPLHVSPLRRHVAAGVRSDMSRNHTSKGHEKHRANAKESNGRGQTTFDAITSSALLSSNAAPPSAAATQNDQSQLSNHSVTNTTASLRTNSKKGTQEEGPPSTTHDNDEESNAALSQGGAVARSQLRAQQAALRALLRFRPRFPPLREEDAVLECGSCFAWFHQECIAPVQRDLMGQVFLCHACRLKWARPYVERDGVGGLISQAQEPPS
ncbi:hypothetical protein ABB37_01922 [Leptomonas pyrrhocoris]|uniref:Uncharacterized protein n=1 Tax=Leptomonas pyrrhocoris TaxID=157538 RepID=A0A0M9G720_LEPPY|nr:hypothetical protein ABB37_01922 [Leptomonas pyrrhocoris]KPA83659.1 hypothetical protein ABB37_01922 [Leptomonas pyrrhocoris]|eukprot:XP_015662098.1 hypothetical protein ABB37_01922 [Leptomonas pyrrhocoris]